MLLERNQSTTELHNDWRQRIKNHFPDIDFSISSDFLSIIRYVDKAPQKFYSKEAFKKYLHFLEEIKSKEPSLLASILNESKPLLNISNKILAEINEEQIHDILLPPEYNDLISFIDKKIHYNLLKLYETPFFHLSHILSKYSWIKQKKGTEGLYLFNSVKELIKLGFGFIEPVYLHCVRNGIAHGKIVYTDLNIIYIDKKGNREEIETSKIIKTFDRLLDISNGFCLAFKVFCFTNPDYLEMFSIPIPQSILIEELQAKANTPAWTITNCLESIALHDRKQLMIYVKNDNWDLNKVRWCSFATAYWAEKLTKCYDRIFFSFHSVHSKPSPIGWAAFNAKRMRELRENNKIEIENYSNVLEDNLLFFTPKIKFPRFVYKLGTFWSIIRTNFPIYWKKYVDTYFPNPFIVRDTKMHSKGSFAVIEDSSVIIKKEYQDDIKQSIKINKKRIVNLAIKHSRKQCNRLSLNRYLPIKYIRVFLYDTDMRIRNLRSSGLIPQLVATVEVNTSKRIKTIDIANGIPEQLGKYRIVWHNGWQGQNIV